jgi:hypothetical protein
MDHQPVLVRIDIGKSGVAALEVESGRRDDPVEQVQRRAGRTDALRRGGSATAE